jgi:D-glycero-alpha-D-manno-heptose-7-phosphate kinase
LHTKIDEGLEIHYDGDIPARSGIGSSSAFTVGLLNALYTLKRVPVNQNFLSAEAIHIERDLIKENVGCQDQCAAAFGGFNLIRFDRDKISPRRVLATKTNLTALQDHLMLVFTGFPHNASNIASSYDFSKVAEISEMMKITEEAYALVNAGRILEFGKLLDTTWKLKKSLSNQVTTPYIDFIYDRAVQAGAIGGKLLGAGGGGFMLFLCEPDRQSHVKKSLENMLFVPFKFEEAGSRIIVDNE